ncbi:Geranylgeranyl diphosphate synthase [hydrothermal vent metagenome]|uniref:Geranylgeranyl diphosphate synthase n=1 Tax=hydrothermal vent metagenome TaxID=652676 RepID=A0A3B0TFV6_9ZZZZ
MFATKRILKVPKDKEVRKILRTGVRMFASKNKMLPPLEFKSLEFQAKKLLVNLDLGTEFLDFTIVLLGNEIWRDTVAATPFNRRLLLLPQCLRNNLSCKGVFDNLGLVCAGCKSCQIDRVLSFAEKLGYTTLVAEGTTVAIGLVEEGSIDAVIGVSCMPVLQQSFEPVARAAIPAIGLPLMNDGCENTNIDYGWLYEEMRQYHQNNELQPLSVSLLRNKVHHYFSGAALARFFPYKDETEKLALKMIAMDGQRMRPLLSVLAYQSYSKNYSEKIQSALAILIECFHKASLIHDDIEDEEDYRYGQPTLHKSNGIPLAINIGDYLIGKGYQCLSSLPADPVELAECFRVVSSSHVNLSKGQGADILLNREIAEKTVDDVVQIFMQKTGEAVKVALLMGAILGGAPPSEIESLKAFSDWFGVAYQIRDDLNEFREEDIRGDAFDFPFLLVLLNREFKREGHSIAEILHRGTIKLLREYFQEFNIEGKATKYLQEYVGKCYSELDKLQNLKLRLSLYNVMGKVFKL